MIDNLEIIREVGLGAVGAVFYARRNDEPVAVKIIDSNLNELSIFRQGLMDNRETLQQLRHPLVTNVQQIERAAEFLYVVSEWINGQNLEQVRIQRQLTLAQIGRIVEQIAQGLSYAHRQGVVHGGLHPRNVLLVNGRVDPPQIKLTDFLLTSLLPGDPSANLLPYLAPEQIANHSVNARSDVYSLGVILYQLVTGRLPFLPKTPAEVAMVTGEPISPHTLRGDIPTAFAGVMLKTVARPIRDRYRSMEEFLSALRPLLDHLPDRLPEGKPESSPAGPMLPAPRLVAGELIIRISVPDVPDRQYPVGDQWLITMGGMPGNDLMLPGEGVSDKHARLERRDDGRWAIVDMGSRRGTFLENSRLLPDVPEEWGPDQPLRIGPYLLTWGTAGDTQTDLPDYAPPQPVPVDRPVLQTLQMNLQPSALHTSAGQPANAVMEIENDMDKTAVVTLTTGGIPADWVTVETGPITVPSAQKVRVPLAIQPPRHYSAAAGEHTFDVIATPQAPPSPTVTTSGTLTVRPFNQSVVALTPPTMRHGRYGTIQITNAGNELDTAELRAIDIEETLAFAIPAAEAPIPPGETVVIPITVTAKKKRPWVWTTTLSPFEIQVKTNQQTISLQAQVIVPPRIPTFLLGLVAILLIAAGGYFGTQNFCQGSSGLLLRDFGAGPWLNLCNRLAVAVDDRDKAISPVETAVANGTPTTPPATPTIPATVTPTVAAVAGEEISIGTSVEGRDLTAVAFGNGPDAVIFVGGIDGGYAPGAIELPEAIIDYYRKNPEAVAAIPDNITLYILPNFNPDAFNSQTRLNANGVRLNSNWPCRWQAGNDAGREPLSEPENQALNAFIEKKTVVAAIFWTFPRTERNRNVVSPGQCREEIVSTSLSEIYAAAARYEARQADISKLFGGDVTNSLSEQGIPAVFVLLNSATDFDLDAHLAALTAVMSMNR